MNKLVQLPVGFFTALELNKKLSLHEAAEINHFKDPEAFEANYPHLVKKIGKRKKVVTFYDALILPPAPPGWEPEK